MRKLIGVVAGAVIAALGVGLDRDPASAKAFENRNGLIAYVAAVNGKAQIFVANPDGTSSQRLTFGGSSARPRWSPDGKEIAFVSNRGGTQEVWVMRRDGSGAREITDEPGDASSPAWSPDGSQVVYTRISGDSADLWIMNADGSNKHPLTSNADLESYAIWSPTGDHIVYGRNAITVKAGEIGEPPTFVRNWELYRINVNGTGETRLTQNTSYEVPSDWRPDGQAFFVTTDGSGNSDIAEFDGTVFNMVVTGPDDEDSAAVAPLGGAFAYSAGDTVKVQDANGTRTVIASGSGPDWGTAKPRCADRAATLWGTSGNDTLVGTNGDDVIVGLDGDDVVEGMGGKDVICGGTGDDDLKGNDGGDSLQGGPGDDVLRGGLGADSLAGQAGDDELIAKDGVRDVAIDGGKDTDSAVRDSIDPAPVNVP